MGNKNSNVKQIKNVNSAAVSLQWVNGATALLILVYTLGVKRFVVPSGLDQTYQWILSKSFENGKIFRGEFLGTYGPLGFLDFNFANTVPTRLVSLGFAFIAYYLFVLSLSKHLVAKNVLKSSWASSLLSVFLLLVIERFTSPSLIICYALILRFRDCKSNKIIWLLSGLTGLMFYLKLFPFSILLIFLIYIVISENFNNMKTWKQKIQLMLYFTPIFCAVLAPTLTSGGRIWLRGYWETLIGYSAMAGKSDNSFYHMGFFLSAVVSAYILVLDKKSERLLYLVTMILFLNYGFVRQDVSHYSSSFFVLILWCVASPRHFLVFNLSKISGKILVGSLALLVALAFPSVGLGLRWVDVILVYFLASFSIFTRPKSKSIRIPIFMTLAFYVIVTTQSPTQLAKGLFTNSSYIGSKSINSRVVDAGVSFGQTFLGHKFSLNPDSSTVALSRSFGAEKLLVISNNDVFRSATFFGSTYLPVPMLFGAFTPWLDNRNVEFLERNRFDKIFFQHETAIDGNSWVSEAPGTSYFIFCNYVPDSKSESWLLLQKLPQSRCVENRADSGYDINSESITVMNITSSRKFFGEELFTDRGSYLNLANGSRFGFQPRNSQGIIFSVPPELDYPYPWNLNILQKGKSSNLISYFALPLS